MQGVQISHAILEAIFVEKENFNANVVKDIIKWNQQLEPSVNMTQSIISSYLLPINKEELNEAQTQQTAKNTLTQQLSLYRLYKAVEDVPKTLRLLQQNKCPKNFMRAYLLFVKKNINKVWHLLKKDYILEQWINVPAELLENYCDTFGIKIEKYSLKQNEDNKDVVMQIKADEFDKRVFELIQKKDYPHCMILIKMSNCQKHHINKLLQRMTNNKEASKAADYVKSLKLNPADYPALGERLCKNTARHFLSKNGWQFAEEIFQQHSQALACVIQDLIFKKKYSEAVSIWYRNQKCRQHIVKQEALVYLKPYIETQGKEIKVQQLKQNYLHKDQFGPSNKEKYFCLEDFGFREEQVVWLDQHTKQINKYLEEIINADVLGIDTESIVGQTKFDKSQHSKFQQAALIQISTRQKVFIIDGFTVKHIPGVKQAILKYIRQNGLIVGHTLDNDMECLLKSLGCADEQIKDLKNIKVVDVWKLFKSVYPKHRFSSLAFITETMLGKELCKDQTLTNWQRRPLRRNQLHYAAMDAVIVIKIYDKFVEEIGQQMVQYYCQMQDF